MKQFQFGQFDPARLLTYVLSRLVESHAIERTMRKSASDAIDAGQVSRSPGRAAGDIELPNDAGRRVITELKQLLGD